MYYNFEIKGGRKLGCSTVFDEYTFSTDLAVTTASILEFIFMCGFTQGRDAGRAVH